MEMIEQKTVIWDENGYKETIVEMVPKIEIPVSDMISQKEEELIRIYNEIEALKARQ
jgi:hypothetical protein